MNPSDVRFLDIGGDRNHHLISRQCNSSHFPILELEHDFARIDEALDGLLFLKPLVGDRERLTCVQAVELLFYR